MKNSQGIRSSMLHTGDLMSKQNFALSTFQITRTLLAAATMFTLIFNGRDDLFRETMFIDEKLTSFFVYRFNIFILLGYENTGIARMICCLVLAAVIMGWYPKITSVLHWYVAFCTYSAFIIVDGGDQINSIITLLLIGIAMCDDRKNAWSAPAAKDGNNLRNFVANTFLILIKLQIAIIYLNSGVAKLYVTEWMNGSAYYYWFTHNAFGAPDYLKPVIAPALSYPLPVFLLTWGTIIFEVCLFGCLFTTNRLLKKTMFQVGIGFHFFIFIFHGLFSFFLVMAGCLVIYLRSEDFQTALIDKNDTLYAST